MLLTQAQETSVEKSQEQFNLFKFVTPTISC